MGNIPSPVRSFRFSILGFLIAVAMVRTFSQELTSPIPGPIDAIAVQPNRQFVVAGLDKVERFNQDGSIDSTFSVRIPGMMLGIENDLSVLVHDFYSLSRYSIDGVRLLRFPQSSETFILQPDGKIIAAKVLSLQRWNPDGATDSSFARSAVTVPVSFGDSRALALQQDGKILAALFDSSVVRFNPDGTRDVNFNPPSFQGFAHTIVEQADGKILVGGYFDSINGQERNGLVRLKSDGTLDSAFTASTQRGPLVGSVLLHANGKIIVSGAFESLAGQPVTNIARLNPDGSVDSSFPRFAFTTNIVPIPLAFEEDGAVLAGLPTGLVRIESSEPATQSFTREGSTLTWLRGGSIPEIFHARFQSSPDGVVWSDLGSGQRIPGGWRLEGAAIPPNARLRMRGYVSGTSYYLDYVPGAPALYPDFLDRTNNVHTDATFQVFANGLEPFNYQWFKDGQPLPGATSSTLILTNVSGADSAGYYAVIRNAEGASTTRVSRLTVVDPFIVAHPSSVWTNVGNSFSLAVAADGTGLNFQWTRDGAPVPGANSPTLVVTNAGAEHIGNYQVVVRGTYGTIQTTSAPVHVNFALPERWNPRFEATTEWFPIQTAVAHNNEVFVGGLFRLIDPPTRQHLVKFRPDGTLDPLFAPEPSGGEVTGVTALSLMPNGQLLVGGNFQTIAGKTQPHLARLNPDGSLDDSFKPVVSGVMGGTYTLVNGIELQPDGRILIGGTFSSVNGEARARGARLFPDGTLDSSFIPNPAGPVAPSAPDALQADGKYIAAQLAEVVKEKITNGNTIRIIDHLRYVLFRYSDDDSEDPIFSPVFDNHAAVKTMRADGSFIVSGLFTNVAGATLPKLARLANTEPATEFLIFDGSNATWFRSGTSPEVTRTTFEFSSDGITWTNLGPGVRVPGGWQRSALQLPSEGSLRALGFANGSIYESTLEIPVRPKLEAVSYSLAAGEVTLSAAGRGGTRVVLQQSGDLKQWTNVQTNSLGNARLQLSLTNAAQPYVFYRLREIPE